MKIKIVALAIVAAILLGICVVTVSCAAGEQGPGATQQDEGDPEDCDAEDFANREDDCGFTKVTPRKTAVTKVTPKGRTTRR